MRILLLTGILAIIGLFLKRLSMLKAHEHIIHVGRENIAHDATVKDKFFGCFTCSNILGTAIGMAFLIALFVGTILMYVFDKHK